MDLVDEAAVDAVFAEHAIDAVIHFAGLKAVGESVREPLRYYHNNLTGTLNLLRVMDRHDVRSIVFSSSATVYGEHNPSPVRRKDGDRRQQPVRPHQGTDRGHPRRPRRRRRPLAHRTAALLQPGRRPPVAAGSARTRRASPTTWCPFIAQVAVGRREKLMVFGGDYDTPDGTCLRDYIHVVDLAEGHVAALDHVAGRTGVFRWNLGSGNGSSVLEVLHAFEKAVGQPDPVRDHRPPRRRPSRVLGGRVLGAGGPGLVHHQDRGRDVRGPLALAEEQPEGLRRLSA